MTIAYISAYVQTETLNVTLADRWMSLLHRAAERPFCVCQLLHYCQLLSDPASTSNLSISLEIQWNVDSNDVLSIRKYQLFAHESNTFLLQNTPLKPLMQWGKWRKNPLLPLEAWRPHVIHECLGWRHSPLRRYLDPMSRFATIHCRQTDQANVP